MSWTWEEKYILVYFGNRGMKYNDLSHLINWKRNYKHRSGQNAAQMVRKMRDQEPKLIASHASYSPATEAQWLRECERNWSGDKVERLREYGLDEHRRLQSRGTKQEHLERYFMTFSNQAWSPEEEYVLLYFTSEDMPYNHIAHLINFKCTLREQQFDLSVRAQLHKIREQLIQIRTQQVATGQSRDPSILPFHKEAVNQWLRDCARGWSENKEWRLRKYGPNEHRLLRSKHVGLEELYGYYATIWTGEGEWPE